MKIITSNPDGSFNIDDRREFYSLQEWQLNFIRTRAKEIILETAPEHKQRNAALGLLSTQETEIIKNIIQDTRIIANQKEAAIQAVTWNGDPSTHAAACDAIEATQWQ
jgi:hypothetical protein